MKSTLRGIVVCLTLILFSAVSATAADTYKLELKGEKGRIMKYTASAGGALDFNLDGLPFPGAKMSGENIAAKINAEAYLDTLVVKKEGASYLVKGTLKNIILGNLLQLPDLGGISKDAAPQLKLDLSPEGALSGLEIKNFTLPGGAGDGMKNALPGLGNMGMDLSNLDSLLPMLTALIPPLFPSDPVAIGDSWVQKPNKDSMPLPIFPILEMKYKLASVDNGVAHIEFTSVGDYDAGFLNGFLAMLPEMPMGDDVMKISKIDLKMNWDLSGTMDLLLEPGILSSVNAKGVVKIDGGGEVKFTHPDGSSEEWLPKLNGKVALDGAVKYEGNIKRAELDELFPPAEKKAPEAAKPAAKKSAKPAKPAAKKPAKKG
ncbi:MAG TPA: hypothetical protein PLQ76_08825 [bacterium]|nr:hypothetical protein [bacterium]